ncbi:MAG: DUF5675 family protein [Patescibacteria group bacterium]
MMIIKRVSYLPEGTFGVIIQDGIPFALTGELPWLNNLPQKSCIPIGKYICKRVNSPKFGNTFEITGVKGRTNILFHKGNVPKKDSKGCVLIGEQFEMMGLNVAVIASGKGYQEFMDRSKDVNGFELEIV